MTDSQLSNIGQVVADDRFVDTDLALRRGRHIDREEAELYEFVASAGAVLEEFYERLGCTLTHQTDGYYYLLPTGEKLGRRQLSVAEMVVGQGLALLYLDPGALETAGEVSRDGFLNHLSAVMGTDQLVGLFNPKKKRIDERVAQQAVRSRVADALKKLAMLGFVELRDEHTIRLRSALMRFAESVRDQESPSEALQHLLNQGANKSVLTPGEQMTDDDVPPDEFEPESPEPARSEFESESPESARSESESDVLDGDETRPDDATAGSEVPALEFGPPGERMPTEEPTNLDVASAASDVPNAVVETDANYDTFGSMYAEGEDPDDAEDPEDPDDDAAEARQKP